MKIVPDDWIYNGPIYEVVNVSYMHYPIILIFILVPDILNKKDEVFYISFRHSSTGDTTND